MQNKDIQNIKLTADGSTTVYSQCFDQHYHSIFGAEKESEVVFLDLGLSYALSIFEELNILEMGFGTGLNALLTFQESKNTSKIISYTGLEAFPLSSEMVEELNFDASQLHDLPWSEKTALSSNFVFQKVESKLQDFITDQKFNLVYYDAFAPESQPELWTQEIFEKLGSLLETGAVLTTYCSKGYVQRNLKAAGFKVEKHPGPPRKREILRAIYQG
ncbi:tRNA (5-methylaminomethyl-2-thiouridine)(34)-methyltransferase MnmD [Jiulongibacter sp. NS-SX5]|uniref:tRNA (5-methylaminomethyl-2-thiouridine)(34)-methyltransferase MnmD n=1 Tax=Jiulongibacter sp. NS-SX5 TaxID=3463854 RepID=UPI00405883C0